MQTETQSIAVQHDMLTVRYAAHAKDLESIQKLSGLIWDDEFWITDAAFYMSGLWADLKNDLIKDFEKTLVLGTSKKGVKGVCNRTNDEIIPIPKEVEEEWVRQCEAHYLDTISKIPQNVRTVADGFPVFGDSASADRRCERFLEIVFHSIGFTECEDFELRRKERDWQNDRKSLIYATYVIESRVEHGFRLQREFLKQEKMRELKA